MREKIAKNRETLISHSLFFLFSLSRIFAFAFLGDTSGKLFVKGYKYVFVIFLLGGFNN
jgi:hypothetical protein